MSAKKFKYESSTISKEGGLGRLRFFLGRKLKDPEIFEFWKMGIKGSCVLFWVFRSFGLFESMQCLVLEEISTFIWIAVFM